MEEYGDMHRGCRASPPVSRVPRQCSGVVAFLFTSKHSATSSEPSTLNTIDLTHVFGAVFGLPQAFTSPQSAPGPHSQQIHQQHRPSADVIEASSAASERPPPRPHNNTTAWRNMLSDTYDTQDDENPTQGPIRNENSGDRAPSLNAASSEEHSPGDEDAPPARGNYLISGISFCDFLYLSATKSYVTTLLLFST